MTGTTAEIEQFFAEFEAASRDERWDRFEDLFLPTFLSLDPGLATPVDVHGLIAFLPRRRGLFESVGATGTRLDGLEVTELDDRHALARSTWSVVYDGPHRPVTLRSTFLLRRVDVAWRIAVYLNHESLAELLATPAS